MHQSLPLIFTSRSNGRKYMATVMGLAEDAHVYAKNASRLPKFREAWAQAWPGLNIRYQPTFLNHENLLGYGLSVGYYLSITESLQYLHTHNETCDYHLFFEDDGVPFNATTWPSQAPNNLDARLDELEAVGGTGLFLGGHTFRGVNSSAAAAAASRPFGGITPARMSYGSFAMLAKCSSLAFIAERLHAHLRATAGKTQVFEELLWGAFLALRDDQGIGTGPYVSAPLLVDHMHGFSATWRLPQPIDRNGIPLYSQFEGRATFWESNV